MVHAAIPSPLAAHAAEELVGHVEEATGCRLPVADETAILSGCAGRIVVGVTEAALAQRIDAGELGTHVPRTDALAIADLDQPVRPRLPHRFLAGRELRRVCRSGVMYDHIRTPQPGGMTRRPAELRRFTVRQACDGGDGRSEHGRGTQRGT